MERINLLHAFEMVEKLNDAEHKVYQIKFYQDCTHIYTESKSITSDLVVKLADICSFGIASDTYCNQPCQRLILVHA